MNFPSRAELARQGHAARLSADDGVTPEAGHTYTVSPCFVFGDRSWIDCLWRVVGISGPNALVEIIGRPATEVGGRIFRIDERAWYPADDLATARDKGLTERNAG